MTLLSKIVNITVWLLFSTLFFIYGIKWTFNFDPGVKGPIMIVIFIHLLIGLNNVSTKNTDSQSR